MSNEPIDTKKPSHDMYTVIGDGKDAYWLRIGAAFPNKDGKGLNIVFNALPVNARAVLRLVSEKPEGSEPARPQP